MKLWIRVEDKLPKDFFCLRTNDDLSKMVVALYLDQDGDFKAIDDWMEKKDGVWDWYTHDEYYPNSHWLPLPECEESFLQECKERFPDLYKSIIECV